MRERTISSSRAGSALGSTTGPSATPNSGSGTAPIEGSRRSNTCTVNRCGPSASRALETASLTIATVVKMSNVFSSRNALSMKTRMGEGRETRSFPFSSSKILCLTTSIESPGSTSSVRVEPVSVFMNICITQKK
eukprot:Amastigsp_a344416_347.p3 type:complete len:135 gc:universal Amastigsp_a344416_347:266-670(+)